MPPRSSRLRQPTSRPNTQPPASQRSQQPTQNIVRISQVYGISFVAQSLRSLAPRYEISKGAAACLAAVLDSITMDLLNNAKSMQENYN